MKADPVPSELRKEPRPATMGEKVALVAIAVIIVYLFIAG